MTDQDYQQAVDKLSAALAAAKRLHWWQILFFKTPTAKRVLAALAAEIDSFRGTSDKMLPLQMLESMHIVLEAILLLKFKRI